MANSKLILIEGIPGSGKTTTAGYIGEYLQKQGVKCRWYLEKDELHPIDCLGFALKDLNKKMPPLWRTFVKDALDYEGVTIMESRLWQNTAMFMFMAEYPKSDIVEYDQLVCRELSPLSPTLINLYQQKVEESLTRIYKSRGAEWMEHAIRKTSKYQWFRSRDRDEFSGWVEFFDEWQQVAGHLYRNWPYKKMNVTNPHNNWQETYEKIIKFLHVDYCEDSYERVESN